MSAPRKPQLTERQAERVERARQVLAASTGKNLDLTERLAKRVGALEFRLEELLALIAELTGGAR